MSFRFNVAHFHARQTAISGIHSLPHMYFLTVDSFKPGRKVPYRYNLTASQTPVKTPQTSRKTVVFGLGSIFLIWSHPKWSSHAGIHLITFSGRLRQVWLFFKQKQAWCDLYSLHTLVWSIQLEMCHSNVLYTWGMILILWIGFSNYTIFTHIGQLTLNT